MARLDQLNLEPDSRRLSTDDRHRIAEFVARCEDMLDTERYRFAWDTIGGMRDRVRDEQVLPTARMIQALDNIQAGASRQERSLRNWGRRYEGY